MGCDCETVVPASLIRTTWGADIPAQWARVDYPCACVSIGAGSQAQGIILTLPSGPVVVTPERPWIGNVPAGSVIRPFDTAGQTVWNSLNDHRLEVELWPTMPRLFPGGARACDRFTTQAAIPAGSPTVTVGAQWVSGREEGYVRIHGGVGGVNYALLANLYEFNTVFTQSIGSGVIGANGAVTVQWTRNTIGADQIEIRLAGGAGTVATVIAETNDRE